jgi:hypothetical protein
MEEQKNTFLRASSSTWKVKARLHRRLQRWLAGGLDAMMFDSFDFKPPRYAAVLSNGMAFLFVMATLVHGKYSWRHSP